MTRAVLWVVVVFAVLSSPADALEPVSALEDLFTFPSTLTAREAAYCYPGMTAISSGAFALAACNTPFGLGDLATSTALAGARFGNAGIMAAFSGSGFDLYGEEHARLGLSYVFLDKISPGIRINRNAMRIKGFGNADTFSADIGLVCRPHERLFAALSCENVGGAELGESCEKLDGRARAAVSWLSPADVTLFASASKVRRFDTDIAAGFLAELTSAFSLGAAAASEPERIEYLCGITIRRLRFSYRGSYHGELGATHGFSLQWGDRDSK